MNENLIGRSIPRSVRQCQAEELFPRISQILRIFGVLPEDIRLITTKSALPLRHDSFEDDAETTEADEEREPGEGALRKSGPRQHSRETPRLFGHPF